ncbi:MAG: protein kinase [Acidobacteriota bacterium]|nr:protein kinase [Acidobacteriota bacterium]
MIGEILGHYRIESQLGEGGMGVVYRAHDIHLDRPVAIKVLSADAVSNPERKMRFVQEARTASALNHPNIVHVYDIGEWNGMDYIAMEYVSGKTLGEIAKAGPLAIRDLVAWAAQIADALAAAHRAGIIHRDIKPANIMVTESGLVKVLDFGLAKLTELPGSYDGSGETRTMQIENAPRTEIGKVVGTVAYMSPEQAEGKRLDARSDMFSFGSVLYEMATGRRAFRGESSIATLSAILTKDPDPVSALRDLAPLELDEIVARCLRKQPAERYPGMAEVKVALEDIRDEIRSSSPSVRNLRVTARKRASRRAWYAAGIALACVLALGIGIFLFVRPRLFPPAIQQLVTILPFRSQGDAADANFSEGLAATIARQLSLLEQSETAIRFAPATAEAAEGPASARKALGVTLVVAGTVERLRDKIIWKAILIDAKTLKTIRQAAAEFPANNILGLQRDSAGRVAALLGLQVPPQFRELLDRGGTTVPMAYESYLRAEGFLQHPAQLPDVDQAIGLFRKAISADSSYGLAYASLGEAYWVKSALTRDKAFAEQGRMSCLGAIANKADLPQVHLTLGKIYSGTGRASEAVSEFQRTIDMDPLNTDAYGRLGAAYQTLGRLKDAEAAYRRVVELRPDYLRSYMQAAGFFVNRSRYQDAEAMYRKVIELVPDNGIGYWNLAAVYHLRGQPDESAALLKKSLAIKPSSTAYANLGTVYWFQGRYSDAVPLMEKAVEMEPNNYVFAGNLAEAYWWVSEYKDKASDAYRHAIELASQQLTVNPNDPNVHASLASYYAKLQDPTEALKHIAQARRLSPMDSKILVKSAFVYAITGRTEQALGALDLALQAGYSIFEIRRAPDLAELRKDPRYRKLERRALAAASDAPTKESK